MDRINVTKTFLPPLEEYEAYVKNIWGSGQITNQGPLLREFERKTSKFLGLDENRFHFVANGTLALQIALRALDITEGEIITTPFSYVATTSAILWERCQPVFVDIKPNDFCIDADKIEESITPKTKAILAVHVFGNPCDIEKIESIAKKYKLKVIYDGAHAFGAKYKGKSLLSYGDISICSFHATKLFHTIEGGCVITKDKSIYDKVELLLRFGHNQDNHFMLGINAKASEFQAAMGLCNLKYIDGIIDQRKELSGIYDSLLKSKFQHPKIKNDSGYNYAYYPIVFDSEKTLLDKMGELEKDNIFPRRYFYPSLNTLSYLKTAQHCPVSEDISKRVICLPLFIGLDKNVIHKICEVLNK